MNKLIKIIFLVVMLGIPVAIFVFLKFFGDNRFDVEVYYENGAPMMYGCEEISGQFSVSDSLVVDSQNPTVVIFSDEDDGSDIKNIEARLEDTFEGQVKVQIFSMGSDLEMIAKCGFRVNSLDQLVLVDNDLRIRGYYERELDEIDRLIVEVKIILENEYRSSNQ